MSITVRLRYLSQPSTVTETTVDDLVVVTCGIVLTVGSRRQLIPAGVLAHVEWEDDA